MKLVIKKTYLHVKHIELLEKTTDGKPIYLITLKTPVKKVIGSQSEPDNQMVMKNVTEIKTIISLDELTKRCHEFNNQTMLDITGIVLDVNKSRLNVWLSMCSFRAMSRSLMTHSRNEQIKRMFGRNNNQ